MNMVSYTSNGKNVTTFRNDDTCNIFVQRGEVRFVNLAVLLDVEGKMYDDLGITVCHCEGVCIAPTGLCLNLSFFFRGLSPTANL